MELAEPRQGRFGNADRRQEAKEARPAGSAAPGEDVRRLGGDRGQPAPETGRAAETAGPGP